MREVARLGVVLLWLSYGEVRVVAMLLTLVLCFCRFTIAAYVGDRQFDPVEASNKKEGKRQAAETALKTLVGEGECSEWARYANVSIPTNLQADLSRHENSSDISYPVHLPDAEDEK